VTSLQHQRLIQNPADFSGEHAFQRMVYFIYRTYLYDHHGLIDRTIIKHMFHRLFAHYEILFLEFAAAYRNLRNHEAGISQARLYGEKWDMLPDGIEAFFVLIGHSGRLPENHRYFYFPKAARRLA
jgi:hypothetical protein